MSTNEQPSTLQSGIDAITGAAQSAYASLTGSTNEQINAEAKKEHAAQEYDASHASAKAGPVNFSSSGAATLDNQNRTDGKMDQTIGSGKEFLGGLIGNENLKTAGRDQHDSGVAQEKQGQAQDLVGGAKDRFTGTIGAGIAEFTGNTQAQAAYQQQHDEGKTTQRTTEAELQKEADAEHAQRIKAQQNY